MDSQSGIQLYNRCRAPSATCSMAPSRTFSITTSSTKTRPPTPSIPSFQSSSPFNCLPSVLVPTKSKPKWARGRSLISSSSQKVAQTAWSCVSLESVRLISKTIPTSKSKSSISGSTCTATFPSKCCCNCEIRPRWVGRRARQ